MTAPPPFRSQESSRPYTTHEVKVELVPRIPASHAPSFLHPSPCITLSPFSRHTSSPIPSHHSTFRLPIAPPTHLPQRHPSPGRSPCTILQQSPLSTSCHSIGVQQRPNPSVLHHDKSPDRVPLRLDTPPPRFQRADSSSTQSSGRLPSQSEDDALPSGEPSRGRPCDIAGGDDVQMEQPDACPAEETPLPPATTPSIRRAPSSSKAGPRSSLSTKTRTSPRKNIFSQTAKQRKVSNFIQLGQGKILRMAFRGP